MRRKPFWKREPAPVRERECTRCEDLGVVSITRLVRAGEAWFFRCDTCKYEGPTAHCSPFQASREVRNSGANRKRKAKKVGV